MKGVDIMISAFIGISFIAGFIGWIFACLQEDEKEREELAIKRARKYINIDVD